MNNLIKNIKSQYEQFPYPRFSWLAKPHKLSNLHARYEAGAALVHGKIIPHQGKKIALLGCGTTEPLVFAASHPQALISACDLSEKTIKISKWRCKLAGLSNVRFFNQSLQDFAPPEPFDYIHSYGVLHHMENPKEGFAQVSKLLNENGFARIMVYSKVSRHRLSYLQNILRLKGISFKNPGFKKEIKKFMDTIPDDHPLKLTYLMHPEIRSKSGMVDSLLHSHETSFTLQELNEILLSNGLFIKAWDFSENILNLLKDSPGMEFLEAFDQWPSSFTFWVSKKSHEFLDGKKWFALTPDLKTIPHSFYSTLLRRQVTLTNPQRELIKKLKARPLHQTELSETDYESAMELTKSRLVLQVKSP